MPRVRTPPPDDVRDLPVDQYREARKRLVDDAYRQQARAADAAAEYRRELDLARSNIDLVEFRDGAMGRGMSAVAAVKFADRIARLREEQESAR